jgi:hypothetical protein
VRERLGDLGNLRRPTDHTKRGQKSFDIYQWLVQICVTILHTGLNAYISTKKIQILIHQKLTLKSTKKLKI